MSVRLILEIVEDIAEPTHHRGFRTASRLLGPAETIAKTVPVSCISANAYADCLQMISGRWGSTYFNSGFCQIKRGLEHHQRCKPSNYYRVAQTIEAICEDRGMRKDRRWLGLPGKLSTPGERNVVDHPRSGRALGSSGNRPSCRTLAPTGPPRPFPPTPSPTRTGSEAGADAPRHGGAQDGGEGGTGGGGGVTAGAPESVNDLSERG